MLNRDEHHRGRGTPGTQDVASAGCRPSRECAPGLRVAAGDSQELSACPVRGPLGSPCPRPHPRGKVWPRTAPGQPPWQRTAPAVNSVTLYRLRQTRALRCPVRSGSSGPAAPVPPGRSPPTRAPRLQTSRPAHRAQRGQERGWGSLNLRTLLTLRGPAATARPPSRRHPRRSRTPATRAPTKRAHGHWCRDPPGPPAG